MNIYWLERTQDDVPAGDDWLSAGERRTLAGLRVPKRRDDWRLGRWTAKCALAAALPEIPELDDIEVVARDSGGPAALVRGQPAGFAMSLSHSRGRGFCAVADEPAAIGCDVESIEPRSLEFVSDYFTPLERAMVSARQPPARVEMVNLLWSAKESASKALGMGLRLRLDSVAVLAADRGAWEDEWLDLAAAHREERVFHGWWRSADGFVWTVLSDPRPTALVGLESRTLSAAGSGTRG